ncbi:hypothetical protein vseg_020904 [Gypsophila vaccaria]
MVHPTCVVEVAKRKLKPLPTHLKYAFLDETESFPMIVSASLFESQLSELHDVLKRNKTTLSYSLDDLKGISLAFLHA